MRAKIWNLLDKCIIFDVFFTTFNKKLLVYPVILSIFASK